MAKRYWIGVAAREHVQVAQVEGFAQFCHGKAGPARRLSKGDGLIYYSSKESLQGSALSQKFTALGEVMDDEPFQIEQTTDFSPFRRHIAYQPSQEIEIRPLIPDLSFIRDKRYWGQAFRFGLLEIPEADFNLIKSKMLLPAF